MIPPGFVKVDHRLPKKGEWALFGNSIIKAPWNYISLTMDILAPDNIPSGWEFVDYRPLKEDDWYLWTGGMLYQCACTPSDQSEKYVIVQRKQKETKEMAIPYGFVKGETRLPKMHEWFLGDSGPEKAIHDFGYYAMPILEPKDIPSGWEFVDYRVPLRGETYLWRKGEVPQFNITDYWKEKAVIVKGKPKVKTPAETLLEEISKLSYTPPPAAPVAQTPASSYGASALKTISENLTKNGWEVIGFRRLAKGDLYVYDPFGLDIRTYPDPTNLNWPALIVRKKRVITDTERLDYLLECTMFESREEIDEEILAVEREDRGE